MNKCKLQCTICPASETSIFSDLSDKQLEAIEANRVMNTYAKKQVIFYEGNPSLGVYCVSEGNVKLYKNTEEGKQRILRLCGKGALLGYASLFSGRPEQYTVEAVDGVKVCFLEKNMFLDFLKRNSEVAMTILARLSQETIKSHEQLIDQTFKSVRRRLAEMLIHLESSFGTKHSKGSLIDLSLSRNELSQSIGATVETTVRLLSELKQEGIISEEAHKIVIVKPNELSLLTSSSF